MVLFVKHVHLQKEVGAADCPGGGFSWVEWEEGWELGAGGREDGGEAHRLRRRDCRR